MVEPMVEPTGLEPVTSCLQSLGLCRARRRQRSRAPVGDRQAIWQFICRCCSLLLHFGMGCGSSAPPGQPLTIFLGGLRVDPLTSGSELIDSPLKTVAMDLLTNTGYSWGTAVPAGGRSGGGGGQLGRRCGLGALRCECDAAGEYP